MKKYYLLLLFVTSFVSAQIVNIPDANFKAKLLSSLSTNTVAGNLSLSSYKIDQNGDNEIQVSEALLVGRIDVSESNITDLTGIEQFVNLKHLICNNNQITSLNVSPFTNLTVLRCHNNLLTSLDLTGLSSIEQVSCSNNSLTSLDASGFIHLFTLKCDSNQINNLNISGLTALTFLDCKINQLSNLNLSGLTNLQYIFCGLNNLTSLNVNGLSALRELYCNTNQITSLNLTGLSELRNLTISSNLFTEINLTDLNIKRLDCKNNFITSLDLSEMANLEFLSCGDNLLQSLELNNCLSLGQIFCTNNNLTSLFIKNGKDESILSFGGNPNLQFICADESQISSVESKLATLGMTATVSNTYCSFTPGGDFNTISGVAQIDSSNNGCDINDANISFLSFDVSLNGVDTTNSVFCNSAGNYGLFTDQVGVYSLIPNLENPTYFNVSPNPATINIPLIDNSTITQNFCITPNGIHPDLEVVIVPIMPARPGFDAVYKIVYKNKGNQTVTGYVNFSYNDAVLDFVSTSVVPGNNGNGFMNWVVPNIAPFQVGSILVSLNVNSPQETPAVNIDDVLVFNAFIDVSTDDNWADNNFNFSQIVVGSYDPNDITCLQGNSLPTAQMGTYLHYNIRFENTGTAPAENIVVTSEIDLSQYNLQSLQVMESSHPMEVKITGNIVEFIFQTINLDTGGHGNILLKMKSNTALSQDLVINSADIFFDYNFPIETNDEQTVFADLSKNDFNKDLSLQVYPNPTSNIVTIKSDSTINAIQVYDAQGRILITKMTNDNLQTIDLSAYATGIYYLSVSTTSGKQTQKIMKK